MDDERSESEPYEVTDDHELQAIGKNKTTLGKNYTLGTNIDASGTEEGWFAPIDNESAGFEGSFDGNGYVIEDLHIQEQEDDEPAGLFGVVEEDGKIGNVTLEEVDITDGGDAGGLAGVNDGEIDTASVSGGASGDKNVGGLVGNNSGEIGHSFATADVKGGENAGGLVGYNDGDIETVYAMGAVDGDENVGGLVGVNDDDGDITDSFATGNVDGDDEGDNVGGLIGMNDGDAENSYSDRGTTNREDAIGDGTGDNVNARGVVDDSEPASQMTGLDIFEDENMEELDEDNWRPLEHPPEYPILDR